MASPNKLNVSYHIDSNPTDASDANGTIMNLNYENPYYRVSKKVLMEFKPVNYIIGVSGVLLNLLIITTLLRRKTSLNLRLKLIASLAMSDELLSCLGTVHLDVCFYNMWDKTGICDHFYGLTESVGFRLCRFLLGDIYMIAQYAGLITMFMIAIDLLKAVDKPLIYQQWSTSGRGNVIVILIWSIPVAVVFVISGITKYPKLRDENMWVIPIGSLYFLVSGLSVFALVVIYCVIFFKLRHQVRNSLSPQSRNLQKAACTTLMIVGTFIICMMPFVWVFLLCNVFEMVTASYLFMWHVLRILYLLNSVLDPIIYAFRIPEVKRGIKHLFKTIGCIRSSAKRSYSGQSHSKDIRV